ncbi:MAG: Ig-like domain-containing protein [Bacilli bacterium]
MKKNKKKKEFAYRAKNIAILIVVWGIGIICLLSAYAVSKKDNSISKVVFSDNNTQMNIYVIDTSGDSVLLESGGNFILMDTGSKDDDNKVIKFVSEKISKSKYSGKYKSFSLYLTEFDENYIGEVKDIFNKLDVDSLYIQNRDILTAIEDDSEEYKNIISMYDEFLSLAKKENSEVVTLTAGKEVIFGDSKITILGPLDNINIDDYNGKNKIKNYIDDSALISMITVGETKYLSMGNISSDIEKALITEYEKNLQADIFKLNKQGNTNSNSSDLLKYIEPSYSIKTYINKKSNYLNDAVKRTMYHSPVYSNEYNGNISINIKNDDVSVKIDDNKIRVKVSYQTENGENLSDKIYYISSKNTLSENWDFFIKNIDGYDKDIVKYSEKLDNISLNNFEDFKGIENLTSDIEITVVYKKVLVDELYLNSSIVNLDVGDSITVKASVEPSNALVEEYIWKSDNEKVAIVKNGKITGVSKGKATITVRVKDSTAKATCEVFVGDYDSNMEGISLNIKNLIIDKNVKFNLSDYVEGNMEWTVSNPEVLEINNEGIITPLKNGIAVITAISNGHSDSLKVTVTDGLIVSNIKGNTTVSEVLNNLKLTQAKILGSFEKYKNSDEIVATGDFLVVEKDNDLSVYIISVIGDVNGEGLVDSDDVDMLNDYLLGKRTLNKAALKAADVNVDGKINQKDKTILENYVKHKTGYDKLPYKD